MLEKPPKPLNNLGFPVKPPVLIQVLVDELGELEQGGLRFAAKEGPELVVPVNVAPVLSVLQPVLTDVLPDFF